MGKENITLFHLLRNLTVADSPSLRTT